MHYTWLEAAVVLAGAALFAPTWVRELRQEAARGEASRRAAAIRELEARVIEPPAPQPEEACGYRSAMVSLRAETPRPGWLERMRLRRRARLALDLEERARREQE